MFPLVRAVHSNSLRSARRIESRILRSHGLFSGGRERPRLHPGQPAVGYGT